MTEEMTTDIIMLGKVPALKDLMKEQIYDKGLWFKPMFAPENYLQEALRELHAAVENVIGEIK